MKFLHFVIIFFVVVLFSCKKDKGNYDYVPLSDFSILRDSLPDSYSVQQGKETLVIDPKLLASDTLDYEYMWRTYQYNGQYPAFFKYDTLGRQRVLKTLINAEPGTTNTIELRVTQKSTKLFKFYTFGVTTITDVPQGWMVAYEKNGVTDIDIVRYPRLLGGTNVDTVYRNQLKAGLGGQGLPGTAINLISGTSAGSGVWLNSSVSGVVHLEGTSFNKLQDFDQMFLGAAPAISGTPFLSGGSSSGTSLFYVNNGVVHWAYQNSFVGLGALDNGAKYRASRWVTSGLGNIALFYDELGKRFLNMNNNSSSLLTFPTLTGVRKFALNNIGKDLVWIEAGFQSNKYSIFKDETGPERYLYVLGSTAGDPARALVPISSLKDIQNAKFFQSSLAESNIFYATDKSVYGFYVSILADTYSDFRESFTAPAGEEITCINLARTGNSNTTSRKMCIATWNETTKVGKMYVYDVTPISGLFGTAPLFETTHDGKITAMENKRN